MSAAHEGDRRSGGNVAGLVRKHREAQGLPQTELAERAQVSRQRIIAAEAGTSLPTLDISLKLAHALGIPLSTMFRAHARDSLKAGDPAFLTELEPEISERHSHWEDIAEQHGLRIEHGIVRGTVNSGGDIKLSRRYVGCFATRPRQRLVFRDRIVGERPPAFAVKGSPKGLGYNMNVSIEGEWAQHRVEFHRPWTAADDSFEFEFDSLLPKAFVLDLDEYNRRRVAEGLAPRRDWRGEFCTFVTYAFSTLDLAIVFPKSYAPPWCGPTATWGSAPPEDADYDEVHARTCQSASFVPGSNEACLTLKRPAPGYLFGIRWQPIAWTPNPRPKGEGK